jgi:DNA-binding response OmpR family regulator
MGGILIVEDEQYQRELCFPELQEDGHTVDTAENGNPARRMLL